MSFLGTHNTIDVRILGKKFSKAAFTKLSSIKFQIYADVSTSGLAANSADYFDRSDLLKWNTVKYTNVFIFLTNPSSSWDVLLRPAIPVLTEF